MPRLITTVVMFQAQNRETKIVLKKLSFKIIWTTNITRPCLTTQPRPRPIFWSETGLVLRPTVSDHITGVVTLVVVIRACLVANTITANISSCRKFQNRLTFWYRLPVVVLETGVDFNTRCYQVWRWWQLIHALTATRRRTKPMLCSLLCLSACWRSHCVVMASTVSSSCLHCPSGKQRLWIDSVSVIWTRLDHTVYCFNVLWHIIQLVVLTVHLLFVACNSRL